MKKIAVVVLFFFINSLIYSADDDYKDLIPEEYGKDEFIQPLKDLRRAEVILIGSYPFSVLFAKLGMDFYDYASSGFNSRKAPSMFGGAVDAEGSSSNVEKVLLTALYISISITVLDFIIGKVKSKGKKKSANKQTVQSREPGPGSGPEPETEPDSDGNPDR